VSNKDKTTRDLEIIGVIRYIFQHTHQKSDPLRLAVLRTMKTYRFQIADEDSLFELVHEVPEFGAAYTSFMMKSLGRVEEVQSYLKGSRS